MSLGGGAPPRTSIRRSRHFVICCTRVVALCNLGPGVGKPRRPTAEGFPYEREGSLVNQHHAAQIRANVLHELEVVRAEVGSYPTTEYLGERIYDIRTVEQALIQLELMGTVERHGPFAESHYSMVLSIRR